MVPEVLAKCFWDGRLLGGEKEKDHSGLSDQGVVTCMLLLYVCKSDVTFLKGKNVKEYAYRKTGMITYLDLLRFNSLLLDV